MADAMDSKSIMGDHVWVQVPLSAPIKKHRFPPMFFKFYIRKFKWGLNGWVSATENL